MKLLTSVPRYIDRLLNNISTLTIFGMKGVTNSIEFFQPRILRSKIGQFVSVVLEVTSHFTT